MQLEGEKPFIVDTYDYMKTDGDEEYKATVLKYANRFMPGKNYSEVMKEYPII